MLAGNIYYATRLAAIPGGTLSCSPAPVHTSEELLYHEKVASLFKGVYRLWPQECKFRYGGRCRANAAQMSYPSSDYGLDLSHRQTKYSKIY